MQNFLKKFFYKKNKSLRLDCYLLNRRLITNIDLEVL
jgi:hypothetical protein